MWRPHRLTIELGLNYNVTAALKTQVNIWRSCHYSEHI